MTGYGACGAQMKSIDATNTNAAPNTRTLREYVRPIVCLLAFTVKVYVGFMAVGKRILCCSAVDYEAELRQTVFKSLIFMRKPLVNLNAWNVKNPCTAVIF